MPNSAQFEKQLPPYLMPTGKPNEQVFFKVDSTTHTVYGLATSEAVDADSEIADYEGTKAEIAKWSAKAEAVTTAAGQKTSKGNIRLQHDPSVIAGKVTRIDYLDAKKQIWILTEPANEEIWKLCEGGFVTGFSISGSYLKKQREGDFTRYWPSIVEISYVDLPCNAEAVFSAVKADGYFEFVKADGTSELRKFRKDGRPMATVPAPQPNGQMPLLSDEQLAMLAQKTADIVIEKTQAQSVNKDKKTKRVGGKDLTADNFAYVGDPEKTETWKFPIHDEAHVRNALARWGQAKGIPADEKEKVHERILAAAKKFGIEVSEESEKVHKALLFATDEMFSESARAAVVKEVYAKSKSGLTKASAELMAQQFITSNISSADDVKKSVFAKSLWDVHNIADVLQTLCYAQQSLACEREWEEDNSPVPDDLKSVISDLSEVFLSLVNEETSELLETLKAKSTASSGEEGMNKNMTEQELQKAHSLATKITKAKEAVTAYHKAHGAPGDGLHKDHHDAMHGHLDNAMKAVKAATDSGDLKKAASAGDHVKKAQDQMAEYGEKVHKMHKAHGEDMKEHLDGIHKAIGTDQDPAGSASGPGAGEGFKGISADDLKKAMGEVIAPLQASIGELTKANADLKKTNEDLAKKVTELENKPAPDYVRSVELPKGVVSIARESVLKSNTISATSEELGELAIG